MSGGWYIYAIVAHDRGLPTGLTGLGNSRLSTVVAGGLAAVAGPLPPGGLQRTTENVMRHGAIVEALQHHGPTLPVRFGTVVSDAEAVASALAEREGELHADLARLGDKVEFGLTVLWDQPPGDDDGHPDSVADDVRADHGPGVHYLRARLSASRRDEARREAARTIAREIDAALGSDVLDRRCSIAPTDRLALRAAFLIEPIRFDLCRQAIGEVRRRHPDLRVLVSGPWSPYSFVSRGHGAARDPLSQSLNTISRWLMPPARADAAGHPPVTTAAAS